MLLAGAIYDLSFAISLAIFWVLPSWLVARYAARRGFPFAGFLILGLLLSWVLALLVAAVFGERPRQA